MTGVIIGWLLGFVVATILWFTLSPFLTEGQEDAISWLLIGGSLVWSTVWLLRRRKADRGPSART
jgi:hypothetical protein